MVTTKKKPILLRIDPDTLARIDRVTSNDRAMEGNRSLFIRLAVLEKLERTEASEKKEAA